IFPVADDEVNVTLPPWQKVVEPEAVIVGTLAVKTTLMVWLAETFVNEYEAIAPCETPSTSTSATVKPQFGVNAYVWLAPATMAIVPNRERVPFVPAAVEIKKPLKLVSSALVEGYGVFIDV